MKSFSLYDSALPSFRVDPFEMLDRVFAGDPAFDLGRRSPAVDVREEEGRYLLVVELPGLSEKDVKLEVKKGILSLATVDADAAAAEEKAPIRWIRRERRQFRLARSFELPEDADAERIEARFRDGLLSIELPKKPETAPRLVPIRAA